MYRNKMVNLYCPSLILMFRASISGGVATSSKACYDSYQLSEILAHFIPRPPRTPPPDEPTIYESVLTTPTPPDVTDFNEDVTIFMSDSELYNTVFEDTADSVSLT